MKRLYVERQQMIERLRIEEIWRSYRQEKREANWFDEGRIEGSEGRIQFDLKAPWED